MALSSSTGGFAQYATDHDLTDPEADSRPECRTCGAELDNGDCPVCDPWPEDPFEDDDDDG